MHTDSARALAALRSPLFLAKVWGQTGSKLYGAKSGSDYVDNQRRFRIFNEVRHRAEEWASCCAGLMSSALQRTTCSGFCPLVQFNCCLVMKLLSLRLAAKRAHVHSIVCRFAGSVASQQHPIAVAQAALEALRALPFGPGEECVIVCNDWHTALLPVLLKARSF